MTETDNPLKTLGRDFAPDFAAWLLDVEPAAVRQVEPLNVDLPAGVVHSDTLFRLDVLATRLEPSLAAYRRIEACVAAINETERLRNLVQAVVSAASTAEFKRALGGE